ncbi:MAG: glycosyltransferase family 39 protein [Taibaiella sp.]|nr:glycosyltransferase family 39 protein [Taibaiella sp.]
MRLEYLSRNARYLLPAMMLLSLLLHVRMLNRDLVGAHVWRQTQTQTVINNFATESLNILEPRINNHAHTDRIHRMEFPVMQWVFALFFKVFGQHIIISRILTLLIGFASVIGMYRLCSLLFNNKGVGVIAAWAFSFSPLFYYYTVNPLPDNFALCCAIWSLVFFFRYVQAPVLKNIIISAVFLCLATLAKLPFVIYGVVAVAYWLIYSKESLRKLWIPLVIYILVLIPAMAWYIAVIPGWTGNGVVAGVLDTSNYTVSGVLHILSGTLVSTLPEMLLNYAATPLFIAGLFFLFQRRLWKHDYFMPLLFLLLGVTAYYLFEINMITLVHDYYLFPFLPLLFIVLAYGAYSLLSMPPKWYRVVTMILLLALPILAMARINGRWDTDNPGFNKVYYHHKEELRNLVPEDSYCVVGNDESGFIVLYYLDRKGWTYKSDMLNEHDLRYFITCGAGYLFVDGVADDNPGVKELTEGMVYQNEGLKVYKLKKAEEI